MSDDYGFKFAIGDIVKVKGTVSSDGGSRSVRFVVTSRQLNQCTGGIQRYYECRGITPDGPTAGSYVGLNEVELEPSEPFSRNYEGSQWYKLGREFERKETEAKAG